MLYKTATGSNNLLKIFSAISLTVLTLFFTACGSPVGGMNTAPAADPVTGATLSAGSTSIPYNSSTTITWASANTTSCTFSGDSANGPSGTFTTPRLLTNTTYNLSCGSATQSITINVASSAAASAITAFAASGVGATTVMTLNTLTNGAQITISGQNSYNGTYTITNKTGTSFDIAKTFVTGTETQTGVWNLAGGMITGCFTTATKGSLTAINLANVPSRFNGVAPLSVFFDASDTTATNTTTPFHDLQYRWDFGDAGAGLWTYGARPGASNKNSESGAVAAHVFESPGVYTISLSATDGTNTVSNSCVQIVVQASDAAFSGTDTVCVSTGTDFTGCPAGAATHSTSSYNTAMGYIGSGAHRLLFKAGEIWLGATDATISIAGPGLIGSFGTGAKPIIRAGTLAGRFLLVQANDWRVVGLDFDGNMTNPNGGGIQLADTTTTILNVHIHKNSWGVYGGSGTSYDVVQEVVMDDIDPASSNAAAVYWTPAATSALLGNYINPTGYGDHVIRMGASTKFVIAHNTMGKPGAGNGEVIKLHQVSQANQQVWNGSYTEKVIISDNHVLPTTTAWQIVVAPQNDATPEHVRDVIVERNWMEAGTANLHISMTTVNEDGLHPSTVRNNILDMSTTNGGASGVYVGAYNALIPVNGVRVYNNTCYSSVAANFRCVQIGNATNTLVYNNLASAPNGSGQKTILIDGGTGTVQASNLLNNIPSDLFANGTPTLPAHFALKSGMNPAADAGTNVSVFDDFMLNARPSGSAWDIGAYER